MLDSEGHQTLEGDKADVPDNQGLPGGRSKGTTCELWPLPFQSRQRVHSECSQDCCRSESFQQAVASQHATRRHRSPRFARYEEMQRRWQNKRCTGGKGSNKPRPKALDCSLLWQDGPRSVASFPPPAQEAGRVHPRRYRRRAVTPSIEGYPTRASKSTFGQAVEPLIGPIPYGGDVGRISSYSEASTASPSFAGTIRRSLSISPFVKVLRNLVTN